MQGAGWRTRAGLALSAFGGVLLLAVLLSSPGKPPAISPGQPTYFELRLMGTRLFRIPASGRDLAAALRAKRFILALLPLARGRFSSFSTPKPAGVSENSSGTSWARTKRAGEFSTPFLQNSLDSSLWGRV